jgi:hypothetical protein
VTDIFFDEASQNDVVFSGSAILNEGERLSRKDARASEKPQVS